MTTMTGKAILALRVMGKFEAGRVDRAKFKLNVSPAMKGVLRRSGMIDGDGRLTLAGWEIEGEHPEPNGLEFLANA